RPDYANQARQVLGLLAEYLETGTAVMAEGTASSEGNLAIAERLGLKNRPFPQNTVFRGESTAECWESVPVLGLLGATTAGVLLLSGFFARGTPRRADRGKSPKPPSASNGEQSQRDREYALIAEHSTDLISTQKLDGTYLFVSPA